MNPSWEWTEADLQELIRTGTQESIELDYKECGALAKTDGKKNEISKDVSAFANSGGGSLVYGMIENGHVPTAIDVGFDPNNISKEWLDQVINSRIHRRIDGVRINQIDLVTSAPGRVAYVVHVPQSMRAPHQAADHKFYKRFNFESVPMEEYEIRDVARRAETPDLFMRFALAHDQYAQINRDNDNTTTPVTVFVGNKAIAPASSAPLSIYIDERLALDGELARRRIGRAGIKRGPTTFVATKMVFPWHGSQQLPIWEGVNLPVGTQRLRVDFRRAVEGKDILTDYVAAWQADSPGMTRKGGSVMLRYSAGEVRIVDDSAETEFLHA